MVSSGVGKAVQVRHYPVTVIAENWTWSLLRPLRVSLGRLSGFVEARVRRPARCQSRLDPTSMGELESVPLSVRKSTGDVKAAYTIDPAVHGGVVLRGQR